MRKRVLVVEGDTRRRGALADALGAGGLEVVESVSISEAIGRAKQTDFAGVLMTDDNRGLAMRGLCEASKRPDKEAAVFVLLRAGSDTLKVLNVVGSDAIVIPEGAALEDIARKVLGRLGGNSPDVWRYAKLRTLQKSKLWEVHHARGPKPNEEALVAQLAEQFAKDVDLRVEFIDAANNAKAATHDNLPRVREIGGKNDIPFVAYDYKDGLTLRELWQKLLRTESWPSAKLSVWIGTEVLAAAEALHAKGIHHGAISPDTIWVTTHGHVLLLHSGIAGLLTAIERAMGASLGMTPALAHLAPEQVKGAPSDARTDIYVANLLIHELLSKASLFARKNANETNDAILNSAVPRPPRTNDQVIEALMTGLERNPAFRAKSATQVKTALMTAAGLKPRERNDRPPDGEAKAGLFKRLLQGGSGGAASDPAEELAMLVGSAVGRTVERGDRVG